MNNQVNEVKKLSFEIPTIDIEAFETEDAITLSEASAGEGLKLMWGDSEYWT